MDQIKMRKNGRQRGSTILLVVAVLLLTMALGMSYMGIVQQDRRSTNELYRSGNIELVSESIVSAISSHLIEDLGFTGVHATDAKKSFLMFGKDERINSTGLVSTDPGGDEEDTTISKHLPDQEMIDYPYTNFGPLNNDPAFIGIQDDAWLASTVPQELYLQDPLLGTKLNKVGWAHLTMIGERYANTPSDQFPVLEDVTNVPLYDSSSINTALTDALTASNGVFADADGDGITDSKWEEAPLALMNGIRYYMAVRVIDNSSLINVNTALSLVSSTGDFNPQGPDQTPYATPSEINLGGFLNSFTPGSSYASITELGMGAGIFSPTLSRTDVMDDLAKFIDYRSITVSNAVLTPFANRVGYWEEVAKYYGTNPPPPGSNPPVASNGHRLGMPSEMELRYRNGLVNRTQGLTDLNAARDLTAPGLGDVPSGLPTAIRAGAVDEFAYNNAGSFSSGVTRYDYLNHEPRHQMTTVSGHTVFAPRLDGDPAPGDVPDPLDNIDPTARVLKVDITDSFLNDNTGAALSAEFRKVLDQPLVGGGGFAGDYILPNAWDTAADRIPYSRQLTATLMDYADNEAPAAIEVTKVGAQIGMEAVPTISEVYIQRYYEFQFDPAAVLDINDWTGVGDTWTWNDPSTVLWQAIDTGFAIEIRNPFNRTISLESITLKVGASGAGVLLSTLSGEPEIEQNEVMVIVWNPQDSSPAEVADIYTPFASANGTLIDETQIPLVSADPTVPGGTTPFSYIYTTVPATQKIIELDTASGPTELSLSIPITGGGTWVYQKFIVTMPDDDGTITENGEFSLDGSDGLNGTFDVDISDIPEIPGAVDAPGWKQTGTFGLALRLNSLLSQPADQIQKTTTIYEGTYGSSPHVHPAQSEDTTYDTYSDIGLTIKTGQVVTTMPVPGLETLKNQIIVEDNPAGDFTHVGNLLHLVTIKKTENDTIAEAWNAHRGASGLVSFVSEDYQMYMDYADRGSFIDNDPALLTRNELYATPATVTLLERFTTLSPADDGLDNDGDLDIDIFNNVDDDEQFVPGTLNLNTISKEMFLRAIPIPNDSGGNAYREALAEQIFAYRDMVDGGSSLVTNSKFTLLDRGNYVGPKFRNQKGINSVHELYSILEGYLMVDTADTFQFKQESGTLVTMDNTPIDGSGDGIIDDREEKAMFTTWLAQMCATRSDIFTAHILIRGFPSEINQPKPIDAIEERRMIVVFDRSKVTNSQDTVNILGTYIY